MHLRTGATSYRDRQPTGSLYSRLTDLGDAGHELDLGLRELRHRRDGDDRATCATVEI